MNPYDIIAENYNSIFPLTEEKLNYISGKIPPHGHITDAGCATAELAIKLAEKGYSVTAIDLNKKMINIAKQKAKHLSNIKLIAMDIRDIDTAADKNSQDAILCLGNTLPHLPEEDIKSFLIKAHSLLKKQGIIILQILNYDRIIKHNIMTLPPIETHNIKLSREYSYTDDKKLRFTLRLAKDGKTYTDSTVLTPVAKSTITEALRQTGYTDIAAYSDYGETPAEEDSFAILYTAKKQA